MQVHIGDRRRAADDFALKGPAVPSPSRRRRLLQAIARATVNQTRPAHPGVLLQNSGRRKTRR